MNAVSYVPAQLYFSAYPRIDGTNEPLVVAWYAFLANLLLPIKAIPKAFYGPGFWQRHEYNLFLGPVALWFAWLGIQRWKELPTAKAWSLAVFAIAGLWIGLGRPDDSVSAFFPYSWLHAVWPGFKSVRVPPRFWFGTGLALVVFSAVGFVAPKSRRGWVVLGLAGLAPLFLQATANLFKTSVLAHGTQWFPERSYPDRIELIRGEPDFPYAPIREGKSVFECVYNIENYRSPDLVPGDLLQITASAPTDSTVEWIGWNRIRLRAESATAVTLSLNLGHFPAWRFEGTGARIVSKLRAPLALHSDTGSIDGELVFEQPWLRPAGYASALSFLGLVAFGVTALRRRRILRIGLTGGIASGKSTAAQAFRDEGVRVVDLDRVGRDLTSNDPDLVREVVALLGEQTRSGTGLNRQRIREIVFGDPEKRKKLEALLHPRIRAAFERECAEAEARGERAIVCEAALLVEGGYFRELDTLVVVTAPEPARLQRLMKRDGISHELAASMLRAQTDDATKLAHANFRLRNEGSADELKDQVKGLMKVWKLG